MKYSGVQKECQAEKKSAPAMAGAEVGLPQVVVDAIRLKAVRADTVVSRVPKGQNTKWKDIGWDMD